ncbi:hypothetical protein PAMP_023912 [Pampus punctatissimus]
MIVTHANRQRWHRKWTVPKRRAETRRNPGSVCLDKKPESSADNTCVHKYNQRSVVFNSNGCVRLAAVCVSLSSGNPPPVDASVSERVVRTVSCFFGEKLPKGCDCNDGAAAEARGCSVLPES